MLLLTSWVQYLSGFQTWLHISITVELLNIWMPRSDQLRTSVLGIQALGWGWGGSLSKWFQGIAKFGNHFYILMFSYAYAFSPLQTAIREMYLASVRKNLCYNGISNPPFQFIFPRLKIMKNLENTWRHSMLTALLFIMAARPFPSKFLELCIGKDTAAFTWKLAIPGDISQFNTRAKI